MRILTITRLAIPEIATIRYARFSDQRGYFTESFRESDIIAAGLWDSDTHIVQCNESFSKEKTIRGLHFQWSPFMGKLVRTLKGHMVDVALDIRIGSPTFGKVILYDMPANTFREYDEWIWLPPGFAHGNYFLQDTQIEYICTGEYNQDCEACISPLANDIDWSLCDPLLKKQFDHLVAEEYIMTNKDRGGFLVSTWERDSRAYNFTYESNKTISSR